jgi:hypothetical protein
MQSSSASRITGDGEIEKEGIDFYNDAQWGEECPEPSVVTEIRVFPLQTGWRTLSDG